MLKYCHFLEDTEGERIELCYLKDVVGREIDFVVLKNKKPLFAFECKWGERAVSPHISYFKKHLPLAVPFYQVHLGTKHYSPELGVEVIPYVEFCKKLGLS